MEVLKNKFVEENTKCILLEKEKEKIAMNFLLERENLDRRMAMLGEINKRLEERSSSVHSYIFEYFKEKRSKVKE